VDSGNTTAEIYEQNINTRWTNIKINCRICLFQHLKDNQFFYQKNKMPPVEERGYPMNLAARNEGLRGLWPRRILPATNHRSKSNHPSPHLRPAPLDDIVSFPLAKCLPRYSLNRRKRVTGLIQKREGGRGETRAPAQRLHL
jgi:hypothetical protein